MYEFFLFNVFIEFDRSRQEPSSSIIFLKIQLVIRLQYMLYFPKFSRRGFGIRSYILTGYKIAIDDTNPISQHKT